MNEIMQNLFDEIKGESKAEASYETTITIARKMLLDSMSVEKVSKYSNLTNEEILDLQNELFS